MIAELIAEGFILFPLPARSKVSRIRHWEKTEHGQYKNIKEGDNYGIALRPQDLVVDIDPRAFSPKEDRPFSRLQKDLGVTLSSSFTVKTGGGGLHIYLSKHPDILVRNKLKQYPGLEFKSAGRYLVGPGSTHPISGLIYTVAHGSPSFLFPAPSSLLSLIQRTAIPFSELDGVREYKNDAQTQGRYLAYLQDSAAPSIEGQGGDHNAFVVAAVGRDFGLPPGSTWELMMEVWNPKCSPPWADEELRIKVVNAYRYAEGNLGSRHPESEFSPVEVKEGERPKTEWKLNSQGGVIKCFVNLLNYLRFPASGLHNIFGHNEFTGQVEITAPAPWHKGRMPHHAAVTDSDLKLLKAYLAIKHGFEMNTTTLEEAVLVTAHDNKFHPVRSWLEGLRWDGKRRLDSWLSDFCGADSSSPYVAAAGRKTLCAAVSRIFHPGCKFDHVLLLEGEQGVGKSGICKILGGEWTGDFTVDPHDKDSIQLMQGHWIVELAELEVARKVDNDALKAFLTRQTDKARLAYGRLAAHFPRQSIFIATKNPGVDGKYLRDETGNRRWWPVAIFPAFSGEEGTVDFRGLEEARNQLFAEAVNLVKSEKGERLFMDEARLNAEAKTVAAERHAEDDWTEKVALWIDTLDCSVLFVTPRDVFVDGLGGLDKQMDRRVSLRIAGIMRSKSVGRWFPGFKKFGKRLVRGYRREPELGEADDYDIEEIL